ncbi:MAG TPA: dTDP-glucose 4,6-dehydratase [Candidatus Paceibacterota bacterium]
MVRRNRKTIFVTGGLGFIGSNYLNLFVPKNPATLFINIDCLTNAGSLHNIKVNKNRNYVWAKINICNRTRLEKLFKKYRPIGVIHFAAESHVDVSLKNPQLFIDTNITGTHNLLSLSQKYSVKRFLQVSTDEVYGALASKRVKAFTEESQLAPNNPYSASKAAAEHLARAYWKTFGLPVIITRASNTYGPNQDKSKLMPLFISRLLAGESVPLYGKGLQRREWLYVADHARGVDTVYRKGKIGEVYNIGGSTELTNLALTKKLLALTGRGSRLINFVPDRLGHDFRYSLNCSKIKRELGWQPKIPFDIGLKKTTVFYSQQ